MSKLRDRKVSFELGADMEDIIRDNTTPRTRPAISEPDQTTPATPEAPKKAPDKTAKPRSHSPRKPKAVSPPHAPKRPTPVAYRGETETVSIVVPVIDSEMVSEARRLAEETGLPLSKAIAPRVRVAMDALRAALSAGDPLRLVPGYKWPEPVYSFRTSIYLTQSEIDKVQKTIDPHGLLSRTKSLSIAVAMYMEPAQES